MNASDFTPEEITFLKLLVHDSPDEFPFRKEAVLEKLTEAQSK